MSTQPMLLKLDLSPTVRHHCGRPFRSCSFNNEPYSTGDSDEQRVYIELVRSGQHHVRGPRRRGRPRRSQSEATQLHRGVPQLVPHTRRRGVQGATHTAFAVLEERPY